MTANKTRNWLGYAIGAAVLVAALAYFLLRDHAPGAMYVFKGVSGPQQPSAVPAARPARWQDYESGGAGRLALLLTDPDSAWLGLAHGLKTIGVPFRITRNYREALRHRVVLVYPTISGRVLPAEALQALAEFPAAGGTLIGVNVEGDGLNELLGFGEAQPLRTRRQITMDTTHPLAHQFEAERELVVPFFNPKSGADTAGSLGYLGAKAPLGRFDDGTAAITESRVGEGHAYAFGIDLGFVLLTGYNNREQGVARSNVNEYEPALDVLLRLLLENVLLNWV